MRLNMYIVAWIIVCVLHASWKFLNINLNTHARIHSAHINTHGNAREHTHTHTHTRIYIYKYKGLEACWVYELPEELSVLQIIIKSP